jgi:hypothetical protein
MLKIFESIEHSAAWLSPLLLVGLGLIVVLAGLFIWLGGLGFKKLLITVAGIVSGGVCGFILIGLNVIAAIALAVIVAFVAIVFERVFITILAAILTGVICFAIVASPYVAQPKAAITLNHAPAAGKTLGLRESIDRVEMYISDSAQGIRKTCSQMPFYTWLIIAVPVIISAAIAIYFWHFSSAVCCSVLGTMFVFAGMIFLLLHKGSKPLSCIYERPFFYLGVFAAMVAFGTIEQLIICKPTKTGSAANGKTSEGKERPHRAWLSWRTT